VGFDPHASSNVILHQQRLISQLAPGKISIFPLQQTISSPNNILTGATNHAFAIVYQSTAAETNFPETVGATPSEFSRFDCNFQQCNQTDVPLTSCRFSRERPHGQHSALAHHGNQQYITQDGSISSSAPFIGVDYEYTASRTTGAGDERRMAQQTAQVKLCILKTFKKPAQFSTAVTDV